MVLVPQVVDQVAPVPVVTAGGIADGRGLAAALAVGAQGVNVGTRFIASEEAELPEEYKACVLAARSDQTVRAPFVNDLVPSASEGAYSTAPRVVRNTFIEKWQGRDEEFQPGGRSWRIGCGRRCSTAPSTSSWSSPVKWRG